MLLLGSTSALAMISGVAAQANQTATGVCSWCDMICRGTYECDLRQCFGTNHCVSGSTCTDVVYFVENSCEL